MGRTSERNLSWWLLSETPRPRPSLEADIETDVAVVGAGLSGLPAKTRAT